MLLIYVSAKDENEENHESLPRKDLQPVMLALTYMGEEYILRDAHSQGIASSRPPGFESIKRLFVSSENMSGKEKGGEKNEISEEGDLAGMEDDDRLLDKNAKNAQMAVALATIAFRAGESEPAEVDYVEHVKKRIKLADKLVVAGYTDSECTMAESENLALRRAVAVRDTLLEGNVDLPIVAVSRPHCCYAGDEVQSRRVEITALFYGQNGPPHQYEKDANSLDDGDAPGQPAATKAALVTATSRAIQ